MTPKTLLTRSIAAHRAALEGGEYTALDLTRACLDRIAEVEPTVGAFLTLDAEGALAAAHASDERRAKGEARSLLDGIPYALKDNFCTAGLRTTAASRALKDFVPPYDATVTARLRASGAILVGKLNMDEFAMGSATETSALGVTRNPLASDYVPGGSSGGSAAAVAALELPFAIGSDTGGSVRQPAAFCGVLGLKPTYGAISRYGMISLASSLDCVGIVTRTAADCAEVLTLLVGKDAHDATSRKHPVPDFAITAPAELQPMRVGVVRELLESGDITPEVSRTCRAAVEALRDAGCKIETVSLPSPEQALAAYCVLSAAEASSNMGRYDGVHYGTRSGREGNLFDLYADSRAEGFGNEVKRRILFGTYMLSEEKRARYYDTARLARAQIRERMNELLVGYDLLLNPTTPAGARRFGEKTTPAQRRRADLCAVYASLAGLPALSVPFGADRAGMPLAVHLTAPHFCERRLLQTAAFLEGVRK